MEFEIAIYKAINRTFTRMFSFSTVVGILKLTSYEVRNIAAIAFAVEQQIPVQTNVKTCYSRVILFFIQFNLYLKSFGEIKRC